MEEIKNAYVKAVWESLKAFIENINCLYDSFEYSENMLRSQKIEAQREYKAFLKKLPVRPEIGNPCWQREGTPAFRAQGEAQSGFVKAAAAQLHCVDGVTV